MFLINGYIHRKPWAAAFLALFVSPVLAMLYLEKIKLAFMYLGAYIAVIVSFLIFLHYDFISVTRVFPTLEEYFTSGIHFVDLLATPVSIIGAVHCLFLARKLQISLPVKWFARWYNILLLFPLSVLFVIVAIRFFAYEPFSIPGHSMSPNVNAGDYIYTNKFTYGYGPSSFPLAQYIFPNKLGNSLPVRGDIIIFRHPKKPEITMIKRIIAMPGETFQMRQGRPYINGKKVLQDKTEVFYKYEDDNNTRRLRVYLETLPNGKKYRILNHFVDSARDNTPLYTVPRKHYFVMGDNRGFSFDSRRIDSFGYVPENNIIARPSIIFWNGSENRFSFQKIQ